MSSLCTCVGTTQRCRLCTSPPRRAKAADRVDETALDYLLAMSDGELAMSLRRREDNDNRLGSIARLGLAEGWSEVRTLRMMAVVLSHEYDELLRRAVAAAPVGVVITGGRDER